MTRKGDTWNESRTYLDPFTLRRVRQFTTAGAYNYHPAYHTSTAWTADGKRFIFMSGRANKSTIFCGNVETGEITQLLDWVDGWMINIITGASGNFSHGVGTPCLDRNSGWVYYSIDQTLRAVNIDTLEERTLIEDSGVWAYGTPTVSPDSAYVAVPANIIPEAMANVDPTRPLDTAEVRAIYAEPEGKGSHYRIEVINTQGDTQREVVYDELDSRCNHLQWNPVKMDWLHTDRDMPPDFWGGSDGVTNRVWTLHLPDKRLVEQPSPSGRTFQVHSVWSWDGEDVLYHCPGGPGRGGPGYVIGVNDIEGNNIVEWSSDAWTNYGHVGAVAGRKAVMIDGNITNDMILWLYYDDPKHLRIEAICKHGTNWGGSEWQYPHPHPQCDPTGSRIVYNAAAGGRSDVFVVEI